MLLNSTNLIESRPGEVKSQYESWVQSELSKHKNEWFMELVIENIRISKNSPTAVLTIARLERRL
jgi:hypothetical protein